MSDLESPEPDDQVLELSEADEVVVRTVSANASFGDRAMFDLPSGRQISGAQLRRLVRRRD